MTDHFNEWLDFPELVDCVQEFLEIGLYEDAYNLLEKYQQFYHDEWEIYFLYSRYYSEQNKHQKAIQCLHKGLKYDKTNPDLLMGLFFVYAILNKPSKGGKYLLRAAKYHPSNEQIYSSLIWYYAEINEIDKAISIFERLEAEETSNPETYRNGGIAYQRSGNLDNAERCFKIALELNPQYDEVVDILADQFLSIDKADKAIKLYRDILKESPRNLRILSRLVFCDIQAKRTDQAALLAKDIIRLYPNSPTGYIDLAYVYLEKEDLDSALEYSNKALDVSPLDAEALRLQGLIHSEKEETVIANKSFESALALEPDNIEIIRDYYTHLRSVGLYDQMELLIKNVIQKESPDCLEEYWFLADYYREMGQNLKSFHFLHKAYKEMPSEKDLIPLMADILIEENHINFSLPILMKYVEQNGWDEIMNEFEHHKSLRGKWNREAMHFLRFMSRQPVTFRKFIFKNYLTKFLLLSSGLIALLLIVPSWMIIGLTGIFIPIGIFSMIIGTHFITKVLLDKQFSLFQKNQGTLA